MATHKTVEVTGDGGKVTLTAVPGGRVKVKLAPDFNAIFDGDKPTFDAAELADAINECSESGA